MYNVYYQVAPGRWGRIARYWKFDAALTHAYASADHSPHAFFGIDRGLGLRKVITREPNKMVIAGRARCRPEHPPLTLVEPPKDAA